MAELGSDLCAEAHPFKVANARRQQAFGPEDVTRIEEAAAHPRGSRRCSQSESSLGPVDVAAGADAPKNRLIGDAAIGVSDRLRCFRRSALTALPSQTFASIERKRIHWPNWATQELRTETEKSVATPHLLRAETRP